jgi:hypothetical protein
MLANRVVESEGGGREEGCPETSVTSYKSTLRKIQEERRSYLTYSSAIYGPVSFLKKKTFGL